jgi:nucleoside 2-deoxyribosyltransferase
MTAPTQALVLSSFENRKFVPVVKAALAEAGIETISLDEDISPGAMWASAITDAMYIADFVVVDLSTENPNIMYELGFAHALRKPTIILVSRRASISRIPSDLAGLPYLFYDPEEPTSLIRELRGWVRSLAARRAS